jgi:hypothetical protein
LRRGDLREDQPTKKNEEKSMHFSWKGLAIGLAAALAVGSTARTASAATCGDLNNSGGRSVADVVLLFRAVLENPDPPNLCGTGNALDCGDINADGNISVADVVILFSSVLGNETLFPLCTGQGNVIPCPGGTATISGGSITSNQVWQTGCTYIIDGQTFVQPNVVLTIQPGTIVKGKSSPANPPSFLAFLRDSKINAQGTQAQPIIMTSDQPVGSRLPGDWGGLILNGRAPVNCPGGECLAEGFATSVPYGGTEPNDSSGIMRFMRVEFAGFILSPDNELNVITHNALGRGTTEDHMEAMAGADDTFEWFGGTEITKFMVSVASADDNFDIQLGTTGGVQYGYAQQYGPYLQNTGQHGFEEDNNEDGNDLLPRTNAVYCNMTLIGAKGQPQAAAQESFGALERRGVAGKKAKTIVVNFKSGGMTLRDQATANVACGAGPTLTGNLNWQDSLFFSNGPTGLEQAVINSSATSPCDSIDLYRLWATQASFPIVPSTGLCSGGARNGRGCFVDGDCSGGSCTGVPAAPDPGISFAFPNTDPRPTNAAAVASNGFDCSTLDASFDNVNYRGAFQPGGTNWLTAPWFSSAIN